MVFMVFMVSAEAAEGDFSLNAALVGYSMDYREYDDNSQILDSEKSDFTQMIGVDLGMTYTLNAAINDYAQLDVSLLLLAGETDYAGAYLESGGGYGSVVSRSNNTVMNFDADYLYGLALSKKLYLLGAAAFGYREWERTLSKDQVEVYSWFYVEPKLGLKYLFQKSSLSGIVGYKYGIDPVMSATGFQDDFQLGGANTFNISLKYSYELDLRSELFFSYVYENQVIDKSNIVYGSDGKGYLEPDSEANNQYLKIGALFKY
jgi:hypothetical protein